MTGLLARSILVLLSATSATWAVTFGQRDDFQNGTTMGWSEGGISPNPPTNIASGGPNGAGDSWLRNIASGVGGAGAKQIMFNQAQWTGNYVSAHVTQI